LLLLVLWVVLFSVDVLIIDRMQPCRFGAPDDQTLLLGCSLFGQDILRAVVITIDSTCEKSYCVPFLLVLTFIGAAFC
jgi:hypothetical protein